MCDVHLAAQMLDPAERAGGSIPPLDAERLDGEDGETLSGEARRALLEAHRRSRSSAFPADAFGRQSRPTRAVYDQRGQTFELSPCINTLRKP